MSKAFIVGFAVGLALLGIIGAGASRPQQKDIEQQRYQAEVVNATPIQLNVMTQKQRVHSRLHNGAGMKVGGKTISTWLTAYKGQRIVLGTDILGRRFIDPDHIETPEGYFGRVAQESDAVIRGKVTGKVSQITEDDSFLFTDYDVTVLEIFKNNTVAPLTIGTAITFTSLGGEVMVDDVILKAGGDGVPLYPIKNQDVLLFLKFVPETGSYKRTTYDGSFELDGTSVRPFTRGFPLLPTAYKDQAAFLKMLKALSAN